MCFWHTQYPLNKAVQFFLQTLQFVLSLLYKKLPAKGVTEHSHCVESFEGLFTAM